MDPGKEGGTKQISPEPTPEVLSGKGRRRSLSFSWILHGHRKISVTAVSTPAPPRMPSLHETTPQQQFTDVHHEIRVLHIHPGDLSDPIVCTLEVLKSPHDLKYEALSYTWGNPLDTRPIVVQGATVHVTKNLEVALRHLRHDDRPRTMWIDAVCINQMDNAEKSVQVQRMGIIFSAASRVVIWIGQSWEPHDVWKFDVDDATLRDALQLATNLRKAYESTENDDPYEWATKLRKQAGDLGLCLASTSGPGMASAVLINLIGRPWFSRVWMIQEASIHKAAPEISFHAASCQFSDLTYTAHYLAILQDFFGDNFGHPSPDYLFPPFYLQDLQFVISHSAYKALPQAYQLLVLLTMTSACYHCTDTRDRVYALLGLVAHDTAEDTISADYTKKFHAIVLETAVTLIQTTQSFALLSSTPNSTPELPSWVPTWNRPIIYARNETYFEDYLTSLVDYPGREGFKYEFSADRKTLYAGGLMLGEICCTKDIPSVITSCGEEERVSRNKLVFAEFEREISETPAIASCLLPAKSSLSVLAHVLEGSRFQWTWEADIQKYDALMDRLPPSFTVREADMSWFLQALALVIQDDTIFGTIQGNVGRTLLGTASPKVQIGDCVVLFPGCLWPLLLRPSGAGYRVLGQCYLHGYTDVVEQREVYRNDILKNGAHQVIPLV